MSAVDDFYKYGQILAAMVGKPEYFGNFGEPSETSGIVEVRNMLASHRNEIAVALENGIRHKEYLQNIMDQFRSYGNNDVAIIREIKELKEKLGNSEVANSKYIGQIQELRQQLEDAHAELSGIKARKQTKARKPKKRK